MDTRLDALYGAACELFIENGYERTQVSEIAKKAGIATGTVYNLCENKKAILHYVIMRALHLLDEESAQLPLAEMAIADITGPQTQFYISTLSYLSSPGLSNWMDLEQLLGWMFDFLYDYHLPNLLIEKNHRVLGEVGMVYWDYRRRIFRIIEEQLARYIDKGQMRAVPHLELHVWSFVEVIAYWGMHVPFDKRQLDIPKEEARRAAVDVLLHGYAAP